MCGIAGFVGEGSQEVLKGMTDRIRHRGPDAEGFHVSPGLGLGHRRLSIVDLEGGDQPMWTADRKLCVVFNGEIYNHAALRAELTAVGCAFCTDHSDTEVLLHAYREWGDAFVQRLNGMWSFALYDFEKRRLFCSRDRFGKKPFFWFHRGGTFGFASELTSLMAHPGCPRSVSLKALQKFYAYALIPSPLSILEGVSKLPGGHNLIVDDGQAPRIERYWRFELDPDDSLAAQGEEALAEQLRELLRAAVRRRLMSDVPLGVFLSGGLDSSTVAALASAELEELQTFSIGFREESFDESAFARQAADWIRSVHHHDVLDLDRACSLLPGILSSLDEPQGDNSMLPTWLLSRFTRENVTVALGGDGGDELFAGYDTFRGLAQAERYASLVPRPVHSAVRALISRMPVSHENLSTDFRIKRGLRGVGHPKWAWNPVWLGALDPAEIQDALGEPIGIEELFSEAITSWETCSQPGLFEKTLQFYTDIYLRDGILQKVDRASMLHSLEVRCPFLDIDVVDFARRLPSKFKLQKGTTKYILKKAAGPLLPERLIHRKKKGFGTPASSWFHTGKITPHADSPFARRKIREHLEAKADERLFLWCKLSFDTWRSARISEGP